MDGGRREPTSTDDPRSIRALLRHDASALVVAQIDVHIVGTIIVGFDGWRGNLYRLAVIPPTGVVAWRWTLSES